MAGRRPAGARPTPRSQHFLRSKALAAQLVGDACIDAGDLVVEIGAGSGRLTSELAKRARHVLAIELDHRWAEDLRGRWPNVAVVEADAAQVALPHEPFRVVANLPFHRTTDLLHLLFDNPETGPLRADLIVEWGVAFRYGVPWPSSLNSVTWGAFYESLISRRLPRTCFGPSPETDAGVLTLTRRSHPLIPIRHAGIYRSFVARGFRHGLRAIAPANLLARTVSAGTTARELDPHQWADLFLTTPTRHGARARR